MPAALSHILMSPYDISWYCMFLYRRPLPNTLLTAPSGHNSSARLKWQTHFFSHHNIIHTYILSNLFSLKRDQAKSITVFFSCIGAMWLLLAGVIVVITVNPVHSPFLSEAHNAIYSYILCIHRHNSPFAPKLCKQCKQC